MFLRRARSRGAGLLLSGEAGAGKTALLHQAAQDAKKLGMRVVPVSGVEFEADIGFGGLSQLLQPLREDFNCLEVRHRTALEFAIGLIEGPAVDRLLVSTAMHELVRLVAAKRPVMLIVDDAQWLDTPTAHVLGFLLRRLDGMPAAIIAACRPGTAPVFEGVAQERIDVQPLDEQSAQELLDSAYPELDTTVRRRLVVEAQGNPLALLELPNALTTEQRSPMERVTPFWALTC